MTAGTESQATQTRKATMGRTSHRRKVWVSNTIVTKNGVERTAGVEKPRQRRRIQRETTMIDGMGDMGTIMSKMMINGLRKLKAVDYKRSHSNTKQQHFHSIRRQPWHKKNKHNNTQYSNIHNNPGYNTTHQSYVYLLREITQQKGKAGSKTQTTHAP